MNNPFNEKIHENLISWKIKSARNVLWYYFAAQRQKWMTVPKLDISWNWKRMWFSDNAIKMLWYFQELTRESSFSISSKPHGEIVWMLTRDFVFLKLHYGHIYLAHYQWNSRTFYTKFDKLIFACLQSSLIPCVKHTIALFNKMIAMICCTHCGCMLPVRKKIVLFTGPLVSKGWGPLVYTLGSLHEFVREVQNEIFPTIFSNWWNNDTIRVFLVISCGKPGNTKWKKPQIPGNSTPGSRFLNHLGSCNEML